MSNNKSNEKIAIAQNKIRKGEFIMPLNILSLHKLQEKHIELIKEAEPDAVVNIAKASEAMPYLPDTDILVAFGQTDLAPILPNAPKLKWIHALTAGVDRFLALEEFKASDIILTNSRGIHGIPIAESVLGTMLSISRGLFACHENQRNKIWQVPQGLDELFEKSAAIIGLGSVGRAIAKLLKSLGMRVVAVKQSMTTEPFVDKLYSTADIISAVKNVDYVIVTLPLTPETRDMFNYDMFKEMSPGTVFINVSRGEIVVEEDLVDALKNKIIKAAALDVFHKEPLPENSPLWDAPNIFLTPHCTASSPQYINRTMKIFVENLRHFPDTSTMMNVIDKSRGY